MRQKINIGLIGCGVIGTVHAQAIDHCEDANLVAVADLIPERSRRLAQQHGVKRVYESGQALLPDSEVDGVVLAMPTAARTPLALQAFALGKHVLIEKPVAMNADEVRKLIAARGSRVGACCSSRYQFLPSNLAVRRLLCEGALGSLRVLRARGVNGAGASPGKTPPEWRLKRELNGGGILVNWGCYDLDFLFSSTNWTLRPETVFAQCWPMAKALSTRAAPGSDAETHALALIRCRDGITLTLERAEATSMVSEQAHQFIGDRGSIRTVMTHGRKTVFHDQADAAFGVMTRVLWEGDDSLSSVHQGVIQDFVSAIRDGHPPRTTLENALTIQAVTDAIYASAALNRSVSPVIDQSPHTS